MKSSKYKANREIAKSNNIYVVGMHGIGDNINQRCFIKTLAAEGKQIYLRTPVPQLYADIIGVQFVKSGTQLRTQAKNEGAADVDFTDPPRLCKERRIFYGPRELSAGGVFSAFRQEFECEPSQLDLPAFQMPAFFNPPAGMPIALIRPTTERKEWHNAARGPLNSYVDQASKVLAKEGYFCISIADLVDDIEWIPDVDPFAHLKFHGGELSLTELMALIARADVVITGVSLVFHAALAYNRPMIALGGGCGGSNHHTLVTDPSCMDLSKTTFIYPDNYCMCQHMKHDCDKRISNLEEKIAKFLSKLPSKGGLSDNEYSKKSPYAADINEDLKVAFSHFPNEEKII